MAVHRACLGVINTATGNSITNLTSWSINREAEEVDTSVMGSCVKSSTPGAVKTTVTCAGFWDDATGQDEVETALATGSSIGLDIYPSGSGAGNQKFSISALNILNNNIEGSGVDALVGFSFTGVANALPTESTVT